MNETFTNLMNRLSLILFFVFCGGAFLFFSPKTAGSFALAAAMSSLNLYFLYRWTRSFEKSENTAALSKRLLFKFIGFFVLVAATLWFLPIAPLPFALGIFSSAITLLLAAILSEKASSTEMEAST